MRMPRRLIALIAAFAAAGAGTPAASSQAYSPAVVAKTCSSGFKHGVIGGKHKCLRRGQYCAIRYDGQYHRFGFHCHSGRLR